MNFDQIQSFFLVATLGTFQKAAERLNSTQPAISARIGALETRMNVRLFDRSGHRVVLTSHGQRFLVYAEQMLETHARAMFDMGQASQVDGVLRTGASDTLVASWLPDFIIHLRQTFPKINVGMRVRASPLLRDDLLSREIDMAFILGPLSHPAVINVPLCECSMALVAAPEFGLHGRKLESSDLNGRDLLTFEKMTLPYQQLHQNLKTHRISVRINPISALQSIIVLTRKGLGLGAVPLVAIEKELKEGSLVQLQPPFELQPLVFTISYLTGPDMTIVEAVSKEALSFLEGLPASNFIKKIYEVGL
jgi:DNA-binding transcriptional LysR family regulator